MCTLPLDITIHKSNDHSFKTKAISPLLHLIAFLRFAHRNFRKILKPLVLHLDSLKYFLVNLPTKEKMALAISLLPQFMVENQKQLPYQ